MARKVLMLAVIAVALAGCNAGPARSPQAGPDWSRGVVVGYCSFNDTVALYADSRGLVHLAWGRVSRAGDDVHYVQLDGAGRVQRDLALTVPVSSPHAVRLLPGDDGGLIVTYLSGVSETRRLYAARLDSTGQVLAGPEAVSGLELAVDEYAAVPSASGADLFWSCNDRRTRGLYHLRLDGSGRVTAPSKLIAAEGLSPDAQGGADGSLHVTWLNEPDYGEERVYYAVFDPIQRELVGAAEVGSFILHSKATRYGPVLALAAGQAYVFWSWEFLAPGGLYFGSGPMPGYGECEYASFPAGTPTQAEQDDLLLPPDPRPQYRPAEGPYAYSQLATCRGGGSQLTFYLVPQWRLEPAAGQRGFAYRPVDESQGMGSSLVYMPSVAPGQREEAAVAVAVQTSTRTHTTVQTAVVYLGADGPKGYQLAGRGRTAIMRPVLAAGGQGQLHLAWLRPAGANRYEVYYASTSPVVRAALGRFGRDDVVEGALALGWGLMQGLTLLPIAFVWLLVPFFWVVGYYLVRPDAELQRRGPRIALGVAIVLYIFSKFFLLPANFVEAAPLVDRLPPLPAQVAMLAIPLAILAAALGALRLYVKRNENPTLLVGFVVFGLTDCLLTFLVYAPGVLG